MFFAEANVKIWLYTQPTDMRKSFNGLSALVRNKLIENPLTGHAFVFINRRRTHIKLLHFDGSGYCIWMKRLEQGQFHFNANQGDKLAISWTELQMIISGIDTQKITQYKRYSHAKVMAKAV
ncbi:MAG: transposase [Puniceicoccaceae bacterium]|nr:MAG: transposase [Puniceicoccaceae bacterium]